MTAVAARARGLVTRMLSPAALAELERATDRAGLARIGLGADAEALEAAARQRCAEDLALLVRRSDALDPLVLDEDRRSVRAIARGLATGMATHRRLASAIATSRLPVDVLGRLAAATTLAALADELARAAHPYAQILASATLPIDLFAIELALVRRFRDLVRPRDHAMQIYVAQLVDSHAAGAALAISTRGHALTAAAVDAAFVPGGRSITRAVFDAACRGDAPTILASALTGTPLVAALFAPAPAALEEATLVWQLATQARLRRTAPLSLAPAIYSVLRRRDEARHLRRAAWRIALGGGA